jgi:F0F1-type ATP synthase membrane subunit b/b'
MIFLTLLSAFLLSGIAAYYSVIGMAAIFPGSFIPVIVMGSALEFSKLVTASWLYRNWGKANKFLRAYLTIAVVILMLITSMGIFGFLSKAHMEHSADMGPVADKVSIYDDKIKTERENIEANRKQLKQMDDAVDQVMGRSEDEKGADKAVAIRRSQQKERSRLLAEISTSQEKVRVFSDERAPIANELRKAESDVGPIKYIAALIYTDVGNDVLDKAVRLVIMLIILVFDPLAVLLLIAGNMSLQEQKETPIVEKTTLIK